MTELALKLPWTVDTLCTSLSPASPRKQHTQVTCFSNTQAPSARTSPDLNVALQLLALHWEVRVVGIVLGHVTAGLVQHGEERAQAAQARQVHDVLQLEGVLQGLGDQTIGCEVRLHNCCCVSLNLKGRTKTYNKQLYVAGRSQHPGD